MEASAIGVEAIAINSVGGHTHTRSRSPSYSLSLTLTHTHSHSRSHSQQVTRSPPPPRSPPSSPSPVWTPARLDLQTFCYCTSRPHLTHTLFGVSCRNNCLKFYFNEFAGHRHRAAVIRVSCLYGSVQTLGESPVTCLLDNLGAALGTFS